MGAEFPKEGYRVRSHCGIAQYILKNSIGRSIINRCHTFSAARFRAADTPQVERSRGGLRLVVDNPRLIGRARRRAKPYRIARLPEHRQRTAGGSIENR